MIRLLKRMNTKNRWMALVCVLLVAGQVFLDLKLPDYTKEITTLIGSESDILSDYFIAGGKMLACALKRNTRSNCWLLCCSNCCGFHF